MRQFSIKNLETLSGIKAHTIRAWEQRYAVLQPGRSQANLRQYDLTDLKRLLNISLLNQHGRKISQLALLDEGSLEKEINKLHAPEARQLRAIHHLVVTMYAWEIEDFDFVLDNCIREWKVELTIEKILIPFLQKVSLLSYQQRENEIHFAVTSVRRKIILGIEKVEVTPRPRKKAVLFLQEGEHFDLVLLYLAYVLKTKGYRVLYLGTNVPLANLKSIALHSQPDLFITHLPHKQKLRLHDLPEFIQAGLPQSKLVVALSHPEQAGELNDNLHTLHFMELGESLTG